MRRTRLRLMAEILAEVAGRPVDQVGTLLADFRAVTGGPVDAPLTEDEYRDLRARSRAEMPGIRAWLARGAQQADPAEVAEFRFLAGSRN